MLIKIFQSTCFPSSNSYLCRNHKLGPETSESPAAAFYAQPPSFLSIWLFFKCLPSSPVLSSDPCASWDLSKSLLCACFPMSTCFTGTSTPFPSANCHKTSVSSLLRMAPAEIGIQSLAQIWSHTAASPRMPHPWALCPGYPEILSMGLTVWRALTSILSLSNPA